MWLQNVLKLIYSKQNVKQFPGGNTSGPPRKGSEALAGRKTDRSGAENQVSGNGAMTEGYRNRWSVSGARGARGCGAGTGQAEIAGGSWNALALSEFFCRSRFVHMLWSKVVALDPRPTTIANSIKSKHQMLKCFNKSLSSYNCFNNFNTTGLTSFNSFTTY